ncbi:MAG: response regulator [Acidobacteriota bacterium]
MAGPSNREIIVLDISMPLLNGLDAAPQLKKLLPDVKVIFLTVHEDPDLVSEAFRVGVIQSGTPFRRLYSIKEPRM